MFAIVPGLLTPSGIARRTHHTLYSLYHQWCATRPNSREYNRRAAAMQDVAKRLLKTSSTITVNTPDFLKTPMIEYTHLCLELKYHVNLLNLLAGCNLGPKLQALYPLEDVAAAIIDPDTIFPVRRALGNLLIEMLKEAVDGLDACDQMWVLIENIRELLSDSISEIRVLFKSSITKSVLIVQRAEWY